VRRCVRASILGNHLRTHTIDGTVVKLKATVKGWLVGWLVGWTTLTTITDSCYCKIKKNKEFAMQAKVKLFA
jgi:hypothetical protein